MKTPPKDTHQVVQHVGGMVIVAGGYQDYFQAKTDAELASKKTGQDYRVRCAGGNLGSHWPVNFDRLK